MFAAMIAPVAQSLPKVSIELWRSNAVDLFDWLMSVDLDDVPVNHPAEKQALADLLTRLEHETDVPGVTQEQIDFARLEVARDMGWWTSGPRRRRVWSPHQLPDGDGTFAARIVAGPGLEGPCG